MMRWNSSSPPPRARDSTRVRRRLQNVDEYNAAPAARRWVGWEEDVVLEEEGRRVVHYYLHCAGAAPRGGGGEGRERERERERELAVVGTKRGRRRMAYVVHGRFLRSLEEVAARARAPSWSARAVAEATQLRLQARREVMDWLTSLVSYSSSTMDDRSDEYSLGDYHDDDAKLAATPASKDHTSRFAGINLDDFAWLGPVWNCKKRQKHYRSFRRRGITISVHDFVHILSEDKTRLVAYVEDLYEDINSSKMVLVRWFDKAGELDVLLPPGAECKDREIFFSYSQQDLRVECIDGSAAVLSAQHFEKFQKCARHSNWQPYLCSRQIDDVNVKSFDITKLQGYSTQRILRTIFDSSSPIKMQLKAPYKNNASSDGGQKRKHAEINDQAVVKRAPKFNLEQQLRYGFHVEVLSQDIGMRGCWYRCMVLKRHKDYIKVQYQDVQNAGETGNLEEWLLLTRIADPDQLGIRLPERPTVRPQHERSQRGKIPSTVAVGTMVDAWWFDAWCEGIVAPPETKGRVRVYFPGEKKVADFPECALRHSLEWIDNKWVPLKERKDIACKLPPGNKHGNKVKSQEAELRAKSYMQKPGLQATKGDEKSAKPAPQKITLQPSKKTSDEPAKPAAEKAIMHFRVAEEDESAESAPHKTSLQSSKKGSDEPAKPAAEKASLQSSEKGDGIYGGEDIIPDDKPCEVDLADVLKSYSLKWVDRKPRGSCGFMDYYSDGSGGSSCQEDIEESSPAGDTAPVNSVPDIEACRTSEEPPFGTTFNFSMSK